MDGDLKSLFPAGLVGTFSTNDFDELAAIPPLWEQEYTQLGRGTFTGRMFLAHTSRMQVGRVSWSPGIMIRGSVPKSCAMFAIPLHRAGPLVNRGSELPDGRGALVRQGEEIDFRASAKCEFYVLVVDEALMERRAEAVIGRPLEALRRGEQVLLHDSKRLRMQLEAHASRLETHLLKDASGLRDSTGAIEFETCLLDEILFALESPQEQSATPGHERIAAEAEKLLRGHLHETLSIADVCQAVGATERNLHLAFRKLFGTTPKAYLKMLRLNAARHELRSARRGETVTEIAARWEFMHFGWFSHDYLAMFGELPSETLRNHVS